MSIWDNLLIGADFGRGRRRPSWLLQSLERHRAHWAPQHAGSRCRTRSGGCSRCCASSRWTPRSFCSTSRRRACRRRSGTISRRCCAWRATAGASTIVLVEHDLDLVWHIADRITVLDAGASSPTALPDAILSDPRVRHCSPDRRRSRRCLRRATSIPATAACRCCAASASQLQPGEILLVLGANGAGKSTLLRTIVGFIKPTQRHRCILDGADVTGRNPEELRAARPAPGARRPSRVSRT